MIGTSFYFGLNSTTKITLLYSLHDECYDMWPFSCWLQVKVAAWVEKCEPVYSKSENVEAKDILKDIFTK
jgi:hypothetical protein